MARHGHHPGTPGDGAPAYGASRSGGRVGEAITTTVFHGARHQGADDLSVADLR